MMPENGLKIALKSLQQAKTAVELLFRPQNDRFQVLKVA
jgi:hypothetical protein